MIKSKTLSVNYIALGSFSIFSFIAMPFLFSLLLIFFLASFNQLKISKLDKIYVNILAAYLSLINSTKTPVADMLNYLLRYNEVPENDFFSYIFTGEGAREPVYSFFNYIGYYLTFGSFQFFIFLVSFVIFSLQFSAVRRYCYYYKVSSQRLFLSCLFIGMLGSYFSLTGHLIRQCLGISIFMYLLVAGCTGGKLNKWLFAFSALIHPVTLFFTPFIFFKKLNQKIDFILLAKLLFVFMILYLAFDTILLIGTSLFEPIQPIFYLFSRLSDPDGFIEVGVGAVTDSGRFFMTSLSSIILIYTFFIAYLTNLKLSPLIAHAIIFSCLLVISLSDYSLLQYRIFFLIYGFIPYILISIPEFKHWISSVTIFMVSTIFYFVFLNGLKSGAWEYASYVDLIANNPLTLLLKYWL